MENNLTKLAHKMNVDAKEEKLTDMDKLDLKNSLSLKGAMNQLHKDNDYLTKKGLRLYREGSLHPKNAKAFDDRIAQNRFTVNFINQDMGKIHEPTNPDGEFEHDVHMNNHILINRDDIRNGRFQKRVIHACRSLAGDDRNADLDTILDDSTDAYTMNDTLENASKKGFSKNARAYLKATYSKPKPIKSFSQLIKIHHPKFQAHHHKALESKPVKKVHKKNFKSSHNRENPSVSHRGPSID